MMTVATSGTPNGTAIVFRMASVVVGSGVGCARVGGEERHVGKYIIKLPCDGRDYYLEWSTIVDAPVTFGMSRDEFEEYYREEYGNSSMREFADRMRRVDEKGTSDRRDSCVEDTIGFNRAGKDETRLSVEQIVDHWIRRRPNDDEDEPELPMGEELVDEEEE
jgi:hypothetical protein